MTTEMYSPKYDYRVKDSLPSGNTAKVIRGTELMEEFESIEDSFKAVGTARNAFAAITYNGSQIVGNSQGVQGEVEWIDQTENGQPTWYFARINFENNLPGISSEESSGTNGDINARANVQVTAFASKNAPALGVGVMSVVVDLEPQFVVVAFFQLQVDGTLIPVRDAPFSLLVVES